MYHHIEIIEQAKAPMGFSLRCLFFLPDNAIASYPPDYFKLSDKGVKKDERHI